MKRLPALALVLVVALASAYGLSRALGRASGDRAALDLTPTPFVPVGTLGAEPSPPDGPIPENAPDYSDWSAPGIPVPGGYEITDHVVVGGRTVRLPPDTLVDLGAEWAGPCSLDEYVPIIQIQVTGDTAVSWVRFTPEGELLRKRIEPDVAPLLEELLSVLTDTPRPTVGPYPNCIVMKGKVIWLPQGALFGTIINDWPAGSEPSVPSHQETLTYNHSTIVFTRDGVLYISQSTIADEDREALAPLLNELVPQ
jgi:hypothetical protein